MIHLLILQKFVVLQQRCLFVFNIINNHLNFKYRHIKQIIKFLSLMFLKVAEIYAQVT